MEVDVLHTTPSAINFKALAEAQSTDPPQDGGAQSLTLLCILVPTYDTTLLCDTSTGTAHWSPQFCRQVFDALHSPRTPVSELHNSWLPPGMCCWALTRMSESEHGHASTANEPRYTSNLHWPVSPSSCEIHICAHRSCRTTSTLPRFTYLLTCVDHFMHWPEVIPLMDITATSMAHAFLAGWIARFGVPTFITTDCGSQVESDLWQQLMCLQGLNMDTYHDLPSGSQVACRKYRQLKTSLISVATST